jgi:uncharacterized protein
MWLVVTRKRLPTPFALPATKANPTAIVLPVLTPCLGGRRLSTRILILRPQQYRRDVRPKDGLRPRCIVGSSPAGQAVAVAGRIPVCGNGTGYLGERIVSARLAGIWVYPIKSLEGVAVEAAEVLPGGALAHDRRWRMVDRQGRTVNGKRTAAVHGVAARFDVGRELVWLDERGGSQPRVFHLVEERSAIEGQLSELLGMDVTLVEDAAKGFPDDTDAPGPTVVSTATLQAVASWFNGLSLDQVRARFRANLEIDGVPAFWEDQLVGDLGVEVPFAIGAVKLSGVNPCARCIVPTRSAETGESTVAFAPIFSKRREQTLPEFAPQARFDHFYRLAVNTRRRPPVEIELLRVGDPVVLE